MSLIIEGSRGILHTSSCFGDFRISLVDSIKEKVTKIEDLTNIAALKILKDIRLQSSIASAALSPVSIIILAASIPVIGLGAVIFTAIESALLSLAIIVSIATIGLFLTHIIDATIGYDDLSKLSRSYDKQAKEANEYIQILERRVEEGGISLKYKSGETAFSYYSTY
jgi:hypothetical protein